jgi:hypothetical protein
MSEVKALNACTASSLQSNPLAAELGVEIPPDVHISPAEGFLGSMGFFYVTTNGKTERLMRDEIESRFQPYALSPEMKRPGEIVDALSRGGQGELWMELNRRGIQVEIRKGSESFYDAKSNRLVLNADATAAEQAEALVFELNKITIQENKDYKRFRAGMDYSTGYSRQTGLAADRSMVQKYQPQTRERYVDDRLDTLAQALGAAGKFRMDLGANGGPRPEAGGHGVYQLSRDGRLLTGDTREKYVDVFNREWSAKEAQKSKALAAQEAAGQRARHGDPQPATRDALVDTQARSANATPTATPPTVAAASKLDADRQAAKDFLDVVESRHRDGLKFALSRGDYGEHLVSKIVQLGQDEVTPCRELSKSEAEFDRGAALLAHRKGLDKEYAAAVKRGILDGEAKEEGQLGVRDDFDGLPMTRKQFEAREFQRDLARLRGFDAWCNVVASMGFGAPGEAPAERSSPNEMPHDAPLEPAAIRETGEPASTSPAPSVNGLSRPPEPAATPSTGKPTKTSVDAGTRATGRTEPGPSPKLLSSKEQKGTGKIESDLDRRSEKEFNQRKLAAPQTVEEVKKNSKDPDDQSEVRMANLFAREGHDVRYNAEDNRGDLTIDGTDMDVKHLSKPDGMVSAINRGRGQGQAVILDGTTVKLTQEQADAGLAAFEREAAKRPQKYSGIKTIYVVKGDGAMLVHHRDTSLKVQPGDEGSPGH